jgi:hypothetical protein
MVGLCMPRDRAEERRRGVNPDYSSANQLLSVIGSANGGVDATKVSVEDSKYLGGDLEHTHLVKGLDYALLNKVRAERMSKGCAGSMASDQRHRGALGQCHATGAGSVTAIAQALLTTRWTSAFLFKRPCRCGTTWAKMVQRRKVMLALWQGAEVMLQGQPRSP